MYILLPVSEKQFLSTGAILRKWLNNKSYNNIPIINILGGPLTVTDANLVLGRLMPDYFPKIFGKTENQPLDKMAATKAFQKLKQEVKIINGAKTCRFNIYFKV